MSAEAARWQLLGERRALALLILGFYTTVFVLVALAQGGAWAPCFAALSVTYGVAFFGVAAQWFWGRWFAMGIATSGVTMAVLGLATNGWNVGLAIWGALHGLIYLPLLGMRMAADYEDSPEWRERYQLDEHGVARVKRAVHSTATALPTLIFYTLAPRQDQLAMIALLALAGFGTVGLLRMRVWGVMLLGLAGAWAAIDAWIGLPPCAFSFPACGVAVWLPAVGTIAALALLLAVAPFARPAVALLRRSID